MVSEKGRVVWSTEALVDLEAIYDFLAEHYYNTSRALMPGARITLPGHTLITRYQYNSLNQLIWQQTPDAGELQFWYNDKGQLRLSQNAQQRADTLYSYTKYDEQGRIVEVGELATVTDVELEDLLTRADSLQWPQAGRYALTDITRTHYDAPAVALAEAGFAQSYLRTRVSWVEVADKNSADTIATYYSYDVHGNVKSLQQNIPGLDAKRTDYAYDLVSGKVNYVMFQFDRPDQFIHRYDYDADNRITSVFTSTDGFIWDQDASYRYYEHGPLARVELGEHRVQGLDYYYTLQGWIKGVNMLYAGDPGGDGITSISGKDVFAYSLGYYNQDYKPINNSVTLSDSRDQLWPRLNEVHGHSGLYNGNISWMITDISKVGEVNNDRAKGMQAMVYKYDQLHRITKSRSITQYNSASGFASRDGSPRAYDEDYSYDPNGNLLTLNRKDHQGSVLHDFNYGYYPNTNKLRQVGPPEDMVYNGALSSNTKLYRKITLQGNAYVPQGNPVEIRALEEIEMDPDFEAADGTDFSAHIVADSGMYQYDKTGNLVLDQHEGVKISWTPYGKVREVRSKSDSLITTFRYDGAGNRIEKKVTRKDSLDITHITHYVRDASGNVMGIYKDSLMTELYVYGSSRLGLYKGGRFNGQQSLGEKQYELSNHLGNVLTVITDNIRMNASDSVWASVVSARDYYPFGLEMEGRMWTDTTSAYKYGFNGKEKDDKGEWGNTVYDYGFRVYNPSIAKFLSVDPLTRSYSMLTPFQFAGDSPIKNIDLDGLEPAGNPADWEVSQLRFYGNSNNGVGYVAKATNGSYSVYQEEISNMGGHRYYYANSDSKWELFRDDFKINRGRQLAIYAAVDIMQKGTVAGALIMSGSPVLLESGLTTYGRKVASGFVNDVFTQFTSNYALNGFNAKQAADDIDYGNALITGVSGQFSFKGKSDLLRKAITELAKTSIDLTKDGLDTKYPGGDEGNQISYFTELVTRQLMAQLPKAGNKEYERILEDIGKKVFRSIIQRAVESVFNEKAAENEGNVKR